MISWVPTKTLWGIGTRRISLVSSSTIFRCSSENTLRRGAHFNPEPGELREGTYSQTTIRLLKPVAREPRVCTADCEQLDGRELLPLRNFKPKGADSDAP